jgi:predicted HicB family RNase H-like nuclease
MPPEKKRSKVLQIRLSMAEHEALQQIAQKRGMSMADLLMEPWRKG